VTDPILSLADAVAETPWSESTLYREAPKPDSPFHKRGGRWVTTESDLLAWVRSGPKPERQHRAESPMPRPRSRRRSSFGALVNQFERGAA
jgi:hypothetical protein